MFARGRLIFKTRIYSKINLEPPWREEEHKHNTLITQAFWKLTRAHGGHRPISKKISRGLTAEYILHQKGRHAKKAHFKTRTRARFEMAPEGSRGNGLVLRAGTHESHEVRGSIIEPLTW